MAVPALNFDLVGDEGGRVFHNKVQAVNQLRLPRILYAQFPVAHVVLEAWAVVLKSQKWLQQDNNL